jgi:quercetin dioxygenase-like cupin family protein
MAYNPSPRPTFDGPAHIPYAAATRHLWGDAEAGEVADWIYVSSDKIHQLMFGLLPGRMFRHSADHRTVFGADEVYYVLSGAMALCNPETGEVQRVLAGEAAFFRRDTWHHAMNIGGEPLRVLEYFAPPPSQGTSGAYARSRPYLAASRYTQDEWLGRWPMAAEEARAAASLHVVRDADALWRLEGDANKALVAILASTEHLTVGKVFLSSGQQTDLRRHAGDEALYLLEGTLNVRLPESDGQRWHELAPGDGFFIPADTPYQLYNVAGQPATALFGVAPGYLPAADDRS